MRAMEMVKVRLIGSRQHSSLKKIKGNICKGNMVVLRRDPQYDKPEGEAWQAWCKHNGEEYDIGYVPLLSTLRVICRASMSEKVRKDNIKWGCSCAALRAFLSEQDKDEVVCKVGELIYNYQGSFSSKSERGELEQVVVHVEI
jgi:hypothetical protein